MQPMLYSLNSDATTGSLCPFAAGEHGLGPSASAWNKSHLDWLRVELSVDAPLVPSGGDSPSLKALFSKSAFPSPDSRLGNILKLKLGRPWDDIDWSSEDQHYYRLLKALDKTRVLSRTQYVHSSSVPTTPQPQVGRGTYVYSPLAPNTQQEQSDITNANAILPSSPPAVHPRKTADSFAEATSPITPVPLPRSNHPVDGTHESSFHPTHRPGEPPSTPSRDSRVQPGMSDATQASASTDRTFVQDSTPHIAPEMTHDKAESDVTYCARVWVEELGICFNASLSSPQLVVDVSTPDNLCVVVGGLQCNCRCDDRISIDFRGENYRPCYAWAEVSFMVPSAHVLRLIREKQHKRLLHGQTDDSILGQELAHLLSVASLFRRGTSGVQTRSTASRETSKPITAYLFSWHHLTGYITRLDILPETLVELSDDTLLTQPRGQSPLRLTRSRKMDLKDANERIDFLSGVATIIIDRMRRHKNYEDLVRQMLAISPRPE